MGCSTIATRRSTLPRAKRKAKPLEPIHEPSWLTAVRAADSKQAKDIRALDLRDISSFADFFVLATGSNARQIQSISDEVESQLKKSGERPHNVEGYTHADWILMDYGDTLIHIFSEKARTYYDLERLWRDAKLVEWELPELARR